MDTARHIVVFDAETTGTSVTKDRIVQFSALKIDGNFNIVEPLKTILINPQMPIPKEASDVHGITDEMVKDKPPFASFANSMYAFFDGCDLAGFNIMRFDVPLLSEEFARVGKDWPFCLVNMIDAYKIFTLKEKRDLSAAVKFYTGKEFDGAHDAGNDVMATYDVLMAQMQRYEDLQSLDNKELDIFCCDGNRRIDLEGKVIYGPDGSPVYGFGKDVGKDIKMNPGFGEWMLKQDFSTNTKNVIRGLIQGNRLWK